MVIQMNDDMNKLIMAMNRAIILTFRVSENLRYVLDSHKDKLTDEQIQKIEDAIDLLPMLLLKRFFKEIDVAK